MTARRSRKQVYQVGFWIIGGAGGAGGDVLDPREGVMGLLGPQFVAGRRRCASCSIAEVLASPGAVCETALVYIARHRNLMISLTCCCSRSR
jgi:hypothetical protein